MAVEDLAAGGEDDAAGLARDPEVDLAGEQAAALLAAVQRRRRFEEAAARVAVAGAQVADQVRVQPRLDARTLVAQLLHFHHSELGR